MNTNTKYLSLTWDTNKLQKKIPQAFELSAFLDGIASEAVFQYEKGEIKGKTHIQGTFTLEGPRMSKKETLNAFRKRFVNVSGLTLSPVYDKLAISAYVTKPEGRIAGPFYAGKNEVNNMEMRNSDLREWQRNLFEILTSDELPALKDRKVIWIQDECGNTGKSWFQKWLRLGQKELVVRGLPITSVDRLLSAVNILSKKVNVDAYTIDFTRTKGEEQSYKDLFSAVEQIKNGSCLDCMYGKYNESYFKPPLVMIFTNNRIEDFRSYLSDDRWVIYTLVKHDSGGVALKEESLRSRDWFEDFSKE